jgi:hypothetical protein
LLKAKAMWNSVQVSVGQAVVRGRFRVEGDVLVLEWRGGREIERFGLLRPDFVAASRLRQLAGRTARAA